ncbi:alpha/beta hydrolase [Kutzneria sp. NPDC051319]|uniref:alpha/beta fold hydrolase n=1 Tax=Kutzneria sp. NPDC051319 TaxID=3155047 RepID=UPI00342DCFF9
MNRRKLLGLAAGVTAAAGAGVLTSPSASAATDHGKPPLLIVHGSHGSGGAYLQLVGELVQRGRVAMAVDLPGHGAEGFFPMWFQAPQDLHAMTTEVSPIAGISLQDNVNRVVSVLRRIGPAILVGHSLGGATVSAVCNAVPHLVRRAVYVSGYCCTVLKTVAEAFQSKENADSLMLKFPPTADGAVVLANRFNWRTNDPVVLAMLREAYMADGTDAQLRAAIGGLQPDEPYGVSLSDCSLQPSTGGRVPRTYVRFTQDRAIPLALQDRMISDAGRFDVHDVAASHFGVMTKAVEVAAILDSLR